MAMPIMKLLRLSNHGKPTFPNCALNTLLSLGVKICSHCKPSRKNQHIPRPENQGLDIYYADPMGISRRDRMAARHRRFRRNNRGRILLFARPCNEIATKCITGLGNEALRMIKPYRQPNKLRAPPLNTLARIF